MTKTRKLQYLISIGIILIVALVLFIVGTIYDKSISENLYNRYQLNIPVFSTILCGVGPLITGVFGAFSGTALFISSNRKSKVMTVLFKIGSVLLVILTSYFAYSTSIEFIDYVGTSSEGVKTGLKYGTLALVIVLDIVIAYFTFKFVKKLDEKRVFWTVLTMAVIICFVALFGEVFKYLASRPRPRLIFTNSEYTFKEWYQWNPLYGFKEHECKSFISGHSNNACSVVTLLPLFLSLTKLSGKKHFVPVSVAIGGVYWLVLMLSRVLAIAHFMTDVAAAGIVSIAIQITALFVVEKIKNKTGDVISPASN